MRNPWISVLVMSVAGSLCAGVMAQEAVMCTVNESSKLLASDGDAIDGFGFSVAIDGDAAIVGAWSDEALGVLSGSAYMLRFDGASWVEEQKINASDGNAWARFGHAVAIDGDVALIGSVHDEDPCPGSEFCAAGSAYVFRYDGESWIEEQKLLPADLDAADEFGFAVALSGDIAVISKAGDDEACGVDGCNGGAAYVFRYDAGTGTWVQEQKLIDSHANPQDRFGYSLAIAGDHILVGERWDDDLGSNSGAVHVFRYEAGAWIEHQKLTASDGHLGADFGQSVRASGDVAVIGSARDDDACPGDPQCLSGSAYVFARDEGGMWLEQQKLVGSDVAAGDQFGWSVDIDAATVVIGSRWDDEACPDDIECNSGAAYVYTFDGKTWSQTQKLLASDPSPDDFFGADVSVCGTSVFVGCYLDDDNGSGSGSIYAFMQADCNENGVNDPCDIAIGTSDDENDNGVPDECEGTVGDATGDGIVDVQDLLAVIVAWGPCEEPCPEDLDNDGIVSVSDLLVVILNWS